MTEHSADSPAQRSEGDRAFAERARSAAHRPAIAVSGPYGRPVHPLLATVPIGAWVCAVVFDVASLTVEGRAYGRAAQWLVLIGIAAAIVTAVFGLLDGRRLTKGTDAHRTATRHLGLMVATLLLFVASYFVRRADADQFLDGTPPLAVGLAGAALVLLVVGAWLGGKLSYRYGVRVVDEVDQLDGYLPDPVERSRSGD